MRREPLVARSFRRCCALATFVLIAENSPILAQMPASAPEKSATDRVPAQAATQPAPTQKDEAMMPGGDMRGMGSMAGMDMKQHSMSMKGMYGAYPMTREASGTSWLPESSSMEGVMSMSGAWETMFHGYVDAVYDHQGGPRGDSKTFTESMFMFMGRHEAGDGAIGIRAMLSLDPSIGKSGYPLLFETGETANGRDPLIDRQHPHDLFMELAASYSRNLGPDSSAFVYVGLPGEPALGPPTFMHRLSGMDNPEAPLNHHWMDSTHITFGVATLGYVWKDFKIDASAFNGREPDQNRWNIETRHFDSWSVRLSYNPTPDWAFQISQGWLDSPEQLEPDVSVRRTTASAIYNRKLGDGYWATTFAWGQNNKNPGRVTNGLLLESTWQWRQMHTVFGRGEMVENDELFREGEPLHSEVFRIKKLSLGYIYDFAKTQWAKFGVGGLVSKYSFPSALDPYYGNNPTSYMIFLRARLY